MTNYNGNDIYCDLIIPRKVDIEVIEETDNFLAYYHTRPHWETHIIVTPKQHVLSIIELSQQSSELLVELFDIVTRIADKVRQERGGCTIFTTTGNEQASKHLHVHIRSGKEL